MLKLNNWIKFGVSVAGALLVLFFVNWAGGALYTVDNGGGQGDDAQASQGYVIAAAEGEQGEEEVVEEVSFADMLAAADAGKGAKVWGKCKSCHKLEEGAHSTGPSLFGVVGRPIAEASGFEYSVAMQAHAGKSWTEEELNSWLASPREYAPGNKMTFSGLKKETDRVNLIAYLSTFGG